MHIDRDLILKLENLAKLELTEKERLQLTGDLNDILKMVGKLNELDTEGVEPLVYLNEENRPLREDEVKNQVSQQAALSNAPERDEQYFKVPKVIKQ